MKFSVSSADSAALFLLASSALPSYVAATATPSTLQACGDIDAALPGRVSYPLDLAYTQETNNYWSGALKQIKPACLVLPTSAAEVSAVVNVLNTYPDVRFAVKSGGHDPNPGHASVSDGILIATAKMKGATYDPVTGLASVGPGGEWNDVIGDLEPYGVTIVGGRLGLVGVGGYLLQGGLSFLSSQYGMAADNIVGWETVMANGSIVNVDAAAHPDLAVAMRGGGSQFGIVTRFKVRAHPIGKVWGGSRVYSPDQADRLFSALHNFTATGAEDPKAAIIHSNLVLVGGIRSHLIYYFYDGPAPPTTGPFADFLKIPALISLTSQQNYSTLLQTNGAPAELITSRVSFRTYTIPFIASDPTIYGQIFDKWVDLTKTYLDNPLHLTGQCSMDFQPIPSLIGQHSEAAGGNALGLRGSDPDRLFLELQCTWPVQADDGEIYALSRQMTDWLDAQTAVWLAQEGKSREDVYLPLFMNDAQADQNVTGNYRDYALFKALQHQVDPNGLFSGRAGGFKF
ncbi:FAD-binding domain-containing protein [Xylariaceae sp. FL0594]|nr:FAD-binding domain-containing protein [Xylariaceae sp. FL0594]